MILRSESEREKQNRETNQSARNQSGWIAGRNTAPHRTKINTSTGRKPKRFSMKTRMKNVNLL